MLLIFDLHYYIILLVVLFSIPKIIVVVETIVVYRFCKLCQHNFEH